MPDLLVRDLPAAIKEEIEKRARAHGQSLSAEARLLLQKGLEAERAGSFADRSEKGLGDRFAALAATLESGDWTDDLIPTRDEPHRPVPDLS